MVDKDFINDEVREADENLDLKEEADEEAADVRVSDRELQLCFNEDRHIGTVAGMPCITEKWRMTERMKTVSVALVLCLNVGVDPPDIVKTQPCARLECWIDPLSVSAPKALEAIGSNLQKQYERWQPRARYKQSLDPTADEVKKLCTSLRRNAKEERVLFHYNGHGVPKPTTNGEIWVFNRSYTQYIPLSVYDLQTWMGAPSIYVYDCSNAGIIVKSFKSFAEQHKAEFDQGRSSLSSPPSFHTCIQLAACDEAQVLPMNPDLPADLFTACLTTPIKVALRWFVLQSTSKLVPKVTLELIDRIPGQIADRRTMFGELNWIFTAITDTIAWNTLPRDLFQKLFRQDLLVASLFRNFLLAERILRSSDCTPVSHPALPPTYQHPMWQAWDLALDLSLGQLSGILKRNEPFVHLPFFEEQLTAFQVWLELGSEKRNPPEQLPIVLQVLLSQVHRMRALELLGRFLDLGPWAVNLALSVGIFPYVLKLLQSCAKELRPLLVFIWAKILAVDNTCQADLVRDAGHKYFISVLQDPQISAEHRTQAAFVLACIVNDFEDGQEAAYHGSLISICLEQLSDDSAHLRQWVAICLGRLWDNYEKAKWRGVRDTAHEKLYTLLNDAHPEVRAAAVYALGTFVNSVKERSDSEHANNIDNSIVITLVNSVVSDMSPLVRKELVGALQWVILAFEHAFLHVAVQEAISQENGTPPHGLQDPLMHRTGSRERLRDQHLDPGAERLKRVNSSSSISTFGTHVHALSHGHAGSLGTLSGLSFGSLYVKVWTCLNSLEKDPHPEVASMASTVVSYIRNQVKKEGGDSSGRLMVNQSSISLPPSPNKPSFLADSPPNAGAEIPKVANISRSALILKNRSKYLTISEDNHLEHHRRRRKPLVNTQFIPWACKRFAQPVANDKRNESDTESKDYYNREWRFTRNSIIRTDAQEGQRRIESNSSSSQRARLETQVFNTRTQTAPTMVRFHPYEQQVVIVGKDSFIVCDWGTGAKLYLSPPSVAATLRRSPSGKGAPLAGRISSLDWVNAHDVAMIMAGCDDGTVKLYRPNGIGSTLHLVSAWQAHSDWVLANKALKGVNSGLLLTWEQRTETVITTGDTRVLRFWDAHRELKVCDLQTGCDQSVTCVDSSFSGVNHEIRPYLPKYQLDEGIVMINGDQERSGSCPGGDKQWNALGLVVIGCADGSVRVFDRRCSPSEARIKSWLMDHTSPVLAVQLIGNNIVSGSRDNIKIYDVRGSVALHQQHHQQSLLQGGGEMTHMAVHSRAKIYACAFSNQSVGVYKFNGTNLNTIRFYEGFMGYRNGPVTCLAFHPYKVALATGTADCSVSVYGIEGPPRR